MIQLFPTIHCLASSFSKSCSGSHLGTREDAARHGGPHWGCERRCANIRTRGSRCGEGLWDCMDICIHATKLTHAHRPAHMHLHIISTHYYPHPSFIHLLFIYHPSIDPTIHQTNHIIIKHECTKVPITPTPWGPIILHCFGLNTK